MEGLRIAACICSAISLLLLIIALASDYWVVFPDGSHVGLWRACKNQLCIPFEMDVQDYVHATRAFLFIGMVAGAVSLFGLGASFSRTHLGSFPITGLAGLASLVAGVCCMIAMSTFTGVYNDKFTMPGRGFGWSFGLGWASFPLFLITGGLAYKLYLSSNT